MKTKTRIISSIFVIVFLASFMAVYAQPEQGQRPGRGMDPQKMLDNLKTKLELSDQQVTDIEKIFNDMKKKREEMRDSGLEREAMRDKMKTMRDEQNEKILALLNPDQQEKYKEMMKKMENRRGSKRGRNQEKQN
jgi:periplasmic protein CpxP/Spy